MDFYEKVIINIKDMIELLKDIAKGIALIAGAILAIYLIVQSGLPGMFVPIIQKVIQALSKSNIVQDVQSNPTKVIELKRKVEVIKKIKDAA